jgi:hypothetical protein
MNSLSRYLIVSVVSCCCASLPSTVRGQTKVSSSISGRITIHGKGAPGITVGIRSQRFSSQLSRLQELSPIKVTVMLAEGAGSLRGAVKLVGDERVPAKL